MIVRTLDLIEHFRKASENLPSGKAVCPKCEDVKDSTHVDDINGAGTYEQLRPKPSQPSLTPPPPNTGKKF